MKKIGVFGCKATTLFLLDSLRKSFDIACVITISPVLGERNDVADYANVAKYCMKHGIQVYHADRYDLKSSKDKEFFAKLDLDIAFVIGWQRLIPASILNTFSVGVFGMHGSSDNLPRGRGRSPMNWALLEQRKHFFTNLFRYDPGVDSGDILDTFVFSIQASDTSETMHYKNVLAMKSLIFRNMSALLKGELELKQQCNADATYYPKRSPEDSLVDWRQDLFQIEAFIRAVTRPFNGAFSYIENTKITLWRAAIFETDVVDYGTRDYTWGEVVEVFPSGKFLVACRGGLLIIHEHETELQVNNGDLLESTIDKDNYFERNENGYHDLRLSN